MVPDDEDQDGWFADEGPSHGAEGPPRTRRLSLLAVLGTLAAFTVVGVATVNWVDARQRPPTGPRLTANAPSTSASTTPRTTSTDGGSTTRSRTIGTVTTQVAPAILGATGAWTLFARGADVLVRLDMSRGWVSETAVPPLSSSGPVSFVVGPDRVLIRPLDGVPGYVVPDGGSAQEAAGLLSHGGPVVPGPAPNRVWAQTGWGSDQAMALVGLDGRAMGRPVHIPADMSPMSAEPDGSGSLLLQGTSGWYAGQGDSLRRVTTGTVLAASASSWLVSDCDDLHRCVTALVDRTTGRRRPLGASLAATGSFGSIAPDGRWAAVPLYGSSGSTLLIIDLATGVRRPATVSPAPDYFPSGTFAWTPDSRWLLVVDSDRAIVALDPVTLRTRPLGVDLPFVDQIAVRG